MTPKTKQALELALSAMENRSDGTAHVACLAIRAADGELLIGIRHYSADMHNQMSKRSDGDKFRHRGGRNQGFVDQFGVYMDRREAFDVAMKAGQIINMNACTHELYSEGVY